MSNDASEIATALGRITAVQTGNQRGGHLGGPGPGQLPGAGGNAGRTSPTPPPAAVADFQPIGDYEVRQVQ
jgi:hypothetical protein